MPRMVDISNNNGYEIVNDVVIPSVDFNGLKRAGIILVGMKASQGGGYADPTFVSYWKKCEDYEFWRLAYCFMNPDDPDLGSMGDEDETSGLFARQIERAGGLRDKDLLALDCEAGSGNRLDFVARTLELIEDRCGVRPGKYSASWYTHFHGLESVELEKYWSWWADYSGKLGVLPVGWCNPLIWQTGVGLIEGMNGDFDLDEILVPINDLLARGYNGGNDMIELNDDDKEIYLKLCEGTFTGAEKIAAILGKYGAQGQSAAYWVQSAIKAGVVLSKELTGTNTAVSGGSN